jgi:hypothetical protein
MRRFSTIRVTFASNPDPSTARARYSCTPCTPLNPALIPDHVCHAMSIVKLLYFDSRLCCEWKCLKSIPYYEFQAMSYLKTLKIDSRLCIPCYVDSEISSFSIPDYVVLKISKAWFQTMYSMLCRVWNREKSFSDSRLCTVTKNL